VEYEHICGIWHVLLQLHFINVYYSLIILFYHLYLLSIFYFYYKIRYIFYYLYLYSLKQYYHVYVNHIIMS